MVEVPRLSSLSGELLKFFFLSSVVLGIVIASALFFLGGGNPYVAVGAGLAISMVWVLLNLLWVRTKIEELFGKLLYVIEILEEKHKEKAVVPIPLHQEILGVVDGIRELVQTFEDRYEKNLRELEEQIEVISENSAKILKALEKLEEGYTSVELPTGMDPVGAIGQLLQQVVDNYRERFIRIKKVSEECRKELEALSLLLGEKEGKINPDKVKEGLERVVRKHEVIARELGSLRDI
ncbi:MAG TPA: hypothetical protein EYH49_00565 [Aquifex aeolicus]|nr:hypothetical protein [Aquifex aeolicus]